jgi:S-methyl-5-thioribose-1-phosphate isomerase
MIIDGKHYRSVWIEGSTVFMINQSLLPHRFEIFESPDHQRTTRALINLIVRGAGAIGSAAAYAVAQAVLEAPEKEFASYIETAVTELLETKISPHTLHSCVERIYKKVKKASTAHQAKKVAVLEADAIAEADVKACVKIGELGASLIEDSCRVLVHGGAGWLASTDWGTTLSPIYTAKRGKKNIFVWVGEGRPSLYGARLTAWELAQEKIPFNVIADDASGYFMSKGEVDLVIAGCERIARNGDIVARIGTYAKAVLAKTNKIPFYVAAPMMSVDWECAAGKDLPYEERAEEEILKITGRDEVNNLRNITCVPEGARAKNPVFDITPAKYISGIITEKGILEPDKIKAFQPEGLS